MPRNITWRQRVCYWFDQTMAAGTPALIGWLALITIIVIVVIAGLTELLNVEPTDDNGAPLTLPEMLWNGLRHALDPGAIIDDQNKLPLFIILMLVLTVAGIFILSTLIGILTAGFEKKIDELRRGRSAVLDTGHILILGWSDTIFTTISELAIANASTRRPCIVVLADKDKVEMEDEIRSKAGNLGRMRVVCRTGSPIDLADLEIVNPQGARAIIILSPGGEEPDAEVIKTILALTNSPQRRKEPYHIVAEIRSPKNMEVAQLVGGTEAQLVEVGDTISRLIAQTSRQSGLSIVYTELLDFGGDEIYFKEEPTLVGKTFGEAMFAFEDSTLLGLQRREGGVQLLPPMDTAIAPGDQVIVISEDDSTVKLSGLTDYKVDAAAIQEYVQAPPAPERLLMLGWNRRAPIIIRELTNYVPPGSTLQVIADGEALGDAAAADYASLTNLTVTFTPGDITDRATLDNMGLINYDHVIVLSYADMLDIQRADARTLIALLHLRDIERKEGEHFSIVSEMLDDRNRALAQVTEADDFIVSDKLISLMLSQIAENKYLRPVFADLFDPEGAEIYLKPATEYISAGQPVNFYTVVEAARRAGQIAIGYKLAAESGNAARSFGVVVNPDKSQPVTLGPQDRVIVLAEE